MNIDDLIYVACLVFCIGAGHYVRAIGDVSQRKLLSTALGCGIILVTSGWQSLHCIVSLALGGLTTLYVSPSKCHLATFLAMFGYLTFFRLVWLFDLPPPSGPTNMIQMILTLKVSGLAFEKNTAWQRLEKRNQQINDEDIAKNDFKYDMQLQRINLVEILHYSFNYIGLLTGPYYRYRTYRDYFETPFLNYAPCVDQTIKKAKWVVSYCTLHLLTSHFWPLEYALSTEFYKERSFAYRLMYVWPTFFSYRMRIYTGMSLSECVCMMAGFGAYPDEADTINGEGPRKRYKHLLNHAEKYDYNFTTIINTRGFVERNCTLREIMKQWNVCVQYWLAMNVYKRFPNKKYRHVATLFCSAYWHGFRPGHYLCLMAGSVYVPLENVWHELIRKNATGWRRQLINILFFISTWFTISYLGTFFVLANFSEIWRFFCSVYHVGYIFWAIECGVGMYLTKLKQAADSGEKLHN